MRIKFFFITMFACTTIFANNKNQNYYRDFWNPKFHGKYLNYCTSDKKLCGQKVADTYCQKLGYQKADKAIIEYNVGISNFIDSKAWCKGWQCNGFKLINCRGKFRNKPIAPYYYRYRKFTSPRLHNYRIAWCDSVSGGCGKKAAGSFCRRMGYMQATGYSEDTRAVATQNLGDGKLCFGDSCRGFSAITCYR